VVRVAHKRPAARQLPVQARHPRSPAAPPEAVEGTYGIRPWEEVMPCRAAGLPSHERCHQIAAKIPE
jgi:hypothetical protein